MKPNIKKYLAIIFLCLIGFCPFLKAQLNYKISNSKDIDMKLSGTSTLHKWTMEAKTFSGEAQFGFAAANADQLNSVKNLSFSLVVRDLKSGEKGLDKNAYKALKTNQYKDID